MVGSLNSDPPLQMLQFGTSKRQHRQFRAAGEPDTYPSRSDATGYKQLGPTALELAVDILFSLSDGPRRVADQRNAALAAVGMSGKLKDAVPARHDRVKVIRLVNQRQSRCVSGDASKRGRNVRMAVPHIVSTGDCQTRLVNRDLRVLVDQKVESALLEHLLHA